MADASRRAGGGATGHSGGGATAIGPALAEPGRVRSLVLAAPGGSDYPWPDDGPFYGEFGPLLAAGEREGLVALGRKTWAAGGQDAVAEAQVRDAVTAFLAEGGLLDPDPPAMGRLTETTRADVLLATWTTRS